MLSHIPKLKCKLHSLIKHEFMSASGACDDIATLTARVVKLQHQRDFVLENIDVVGKDESRQRLARLNNEISHLEQEMSNLRASAPWDEQRVEATVEILVSQLGNLNQRLTQMPIAALRRVLEILVRKAEVQLESRAATFELALPRWAFEKPDLFNEALFLEGTSGRKCDLKEQMLVVMTYRAFWLGDTYLGYGVAACSSRRSA
jgi:hypothetical protein